MPVGLTFAGRAYDDTALLSYGAAFEATGDPASPAAADSAAIGVGALGPS